jgi:hypothetical protein
MMKLAYSMLTVVLFAFLAALPTQATEPPQALGLVATTDPVPLTCSAYECEIVVSAFCLQQARRSPSPDDLYRPVRDDMIRFSLGVKGGSLTALDALPMSIRPDPEYTSVRLIVRRPASLEAESVSVWLTVAPNASLVPIGGEESNSMAVATGAHRRIAAGFFDNGDKRAKAVRLAARLMNALPRNGRLDPAQRQSVWQDAAGASALGDGSVHKWIGEVYRNCAKAADASQRHTLRRCLADWHHQSLSKTNRSFWSALAGV